MYERYLVTGATGFLGRAIIDALLKQNNTYKIYALVQRGDPLVRKLLPKVTVIYGDLCDAASLTNFFSYANSKTCVIHCAGMVSVASDPGYRIYMINASGTAAVIRQCEKAHVGKLIYVSSVHAIPEKEHGKTMTEDTVFCPDLVTGYYARTKAIATKMVFDACARGLNANVVFPSGIIGPGDYGMGSFSYMLSSFINGVLPFAIKGEYDFVDVRDVADGIVSCVDFGEPGQGYILSGHIISIKDMLNIAKSTLGLNYRPVYLPIGLAKLIAPIYEKRSRRLGLPCFFTPYSVSVLKSNCNFSHEAATAAFGYIPRPYEDSVQDMTLWLNAYKHLF